MKKIDRIIKKKLNKWIKTIPLMFNNPNFLTDLHNSINYKDQLKSFTFEVKLMKEEQDLINDKIKSKIDEIILNGFKDKTILNLFNVFISSLMIYLEKSTKDVDVEYDILSQYTELIRYLKDNYKKNFNSFLIFVNSNIFKVLKEYKK